MKKIKKLDPPRVLYFIFLGIVFLEVVASFVSIFIAGNSEQRDAAISNVFLGFLAAILFSLPWIIQSRFKVKIPNYLEIFVLLFLFSAIVLGNIHGLLVSVKGYDKFLHINSGIFISLIGYEIILGYNQAKPKEIRLSAGLMSIFAFCFSLTLLLVWEFYEFFVDTIAYNINNETTRNMQRYQWLYEGSFFPQPYGLIDTMLDLIIGSIGAAIISIFGWRIILYKQNKKKGV